MKKLLFGILTFLGIGLSFCSAVSINCPNVIILSADNPCYTWQPSIDCYYLDLDFEGGIEADSYRIFAKYLHNGNLDSIDVQQPLGYNTPRGVNINLSNQDGVSSGYYCFVDSTLYDSLTSNDYLAYYYLPKSFGGSSSSDIDVFYNNGNSTETITCDGVQAIQINGLSTITSSNTFTPYYNISYIDEDNQKLTESYSKDILYLENGQFKKTYTGDNERILTVQGNDSENSFSGYLPTFEITGGIEEVTDSGNIFNNFAENSVKFAFSNIPSYIQYVLMFALLMLILGLVKPFKRGR